MSTNYRRWTVLLWCVFAGYLAFIALEYLRGADRAARGERPLYTDFTPTYAASLLLRSHPAEMLYHPATMRAAQTQAAHAAYAGITAQQARNVGFSAWQYPPTFILVALPLALLPYLPALFAWLALTAIPYLAAMARILPPRLAVPMALAAPPTFYNLMYGQTGFLAAGLITLGLLSLKTRPLLAGVFIGLASVKPHLGLLLPFALAAGGHWRSFAAAAATVIALIAASIASFGLEPWYAFIGTLEFQRQGFEVGAYNYRAMATVFASLRLAGLSLATAGWLQAGFGLLVLGVVFHAWRHPHGGMRGDHLRHALLCVATPLALPVAYVYDLVLVAPAIAWLWLDMQDHGTRRRHAAGLLLATGLLLACVPVARQFDVQLGGVALLLLFWLTLARLRLAGESAS